MEFTITVQPQGAVPLWHWLVVRGGKDGGPVSSGAEATAERAREKAEAAADDLAQMIAERQTYTYNTDDQVRS